MLEGFVAFVQVVEFAHLRLEGFDVAFLALTECSLFECEVSSCGRVFGVSFSVVRS